MLGQTFNSSRSLTTMCAVNSGYRTALSRTELTHQNMGSSLEGNQIILLIIKPFIHSFVRSFISINLFRRLQ